MHARAYSHTHVTYSLSLTLCLPPLTPLSSLSPLSLSPPSNPPLSSSLSFLSPPPLSLSLPPLPHLLSPSLSRSSLPHSSLFPHLFLLLWLSLFSLLPSLLRPSHFSLFLFSLQLPPLCPPSLFLFLISSFMAMRLSPGALIRIPLLIPANRAREIIFFFGRSPPSGCVRQWMIGYMASGPTNHRGRKKTPIFLSKQMSLGVEGTQSPLTEFSEWACRYNYTSVALLLPHNEPVVTIILV